MSSEPREHIADAMKTSGLMPIVGGIPQTNPSWPSPFADDDDEVQEALKFFNSGGKYGLSKHEQVLSPEQQVTGKKLVPELISKSMNSYQNFENSTLSPINLPGPRKVVGLQESILKDSGLHFLKFLGIIFDDFLHF